jgi:hypothetical protein
MCRRLWRRASIGELKQILVAGCVAAIFAALIGLWIMPASQISANRVPFSVVFIDASSRLRRSPFRGCSLERFGLEIQSPSH